MLYAALLWKKIYEDKARYVPAKNKPFMDFLYFAFLLTDCCCENLFPLFVEKFKNKSATMKKPKGLCGLD